MIAFIARRINMILCNNTSNWVEMKNTQTHKKTQIRPPNFPPNTNFYKIWRRGHDPSSRFLEISQISKNKNNNKK